MTDLFEMVWFRPHARCAARHSATNTDAVELSPGEVAPARTEPADPGIAAHGLNILTELVANAARARRPEQACALAAETLARYPAEVAFAHVYLFDANGRSARLVGATRPLAPDEVWPVEEVANSGQTLFLAERSVLVVPLRTAGEAQPLGVLVAGAGPGLALNGESRRFFEQVAAHIAATVAVARIQAEAERHKEIVALQDHALQTFFVIGLVARAALADMPPDRVTDSVAAALVQIIDVAAMGSEHLREAIFALGHGEVGQSGIIDSLQRLVRAFQQRTGIEAELLVSGTPSRLSSEMAETLHLAAVESLANVESHSRAGAVVLSLHIARHTVTLTVQDDGVGAANRVVERIASSATHFGLRGIGQRVRQSGGTFNAQVSHDGGFRVRVRLPLKRALRQ